MQFDVVDARQMTADLTAQWRSLVRGAGELDSPFFQPEFTQLIAQVRDDVRVAVLNAGGQAIGVLPFQLERPGVGVFAGGGWSHLQGMIAPADACWSPQGLLAACKLSAFRFPRLLTEQQTLMPCHWPWLASTSPWIDLRGGFAAYAARRKKSRGDEFPVALRRIRKLERELGPVRFELRTTDWRVLESLIDWRIQEFRRRRATNLLGPAWGASLLQQAARTTGEPLSGMLSALFAGGRLAAAHFGLCAGKVMHSWVAAEDRQLARCSPGLVLLLEIARACEGLGIERLELGTEHDAYRGLLVSGERTLACGELNARPMAHALRRSWSRTRATLGSVPFGQPVSRALRTASAWLFHG